MDDHQSLMTEGLKLSVKGWQSHTVKERHCLSVGILGWIGRGNAGDQLLMTGISLALHRCGAKPIVISGRLTKSIANDLHGLIIGGGSLLDGPLDVDPDVDLNSMPIAYISVGLETSIHPDHKKFLTQAYLVIHRTFSKSRELVVQAEVGKDGRSIETFRWHALPDIVYTLPAGERQQSNPTWPSILIFPNMELIPSWNDPHWKHVAWDRFKDEFAQALDILVSKGWQITFMSSCHNPKQDDMWASVEILTRMTKRKSEMISTQYLSHDSMEATSQISNFRVVISQRFHGAILARMANVPCMSIWHHNKLRDHWPAPVASLPYHGFTKDQMLVEFHGKLLAPLLDQTPVGLVDNTLAKAYDSHIKSFLSLLEICE